MLIRFCFEFIWHICQSAISRLIYFSSIVKLRSNCSRNQPVVSNEVKDLLICICYNIYLFVLFCFFCPHFRYCNLTVFGALHAPLEDLVFKGYTIPATALVAPDMDSVFMDPKIWTDPEVFRPGRFIDDQGKLESKEEFLAFFIGKILFNSFIL